MIIKISKENFKNEIETSDKLIILNFSSQWCSPCKMIAPIIDEITTENSLIKSCKVNIDEELEITQQFKIMSIPTILIIKNNEILQRIVGYKSKPALLKIINKYI